MSQQHKNILILKPSALGDLIQVLPTLHSLRKACPDARITWFVRKEYAPLIEGHPDLDDLIHFDRKFLGKAHYHGGAFSALINLIKQLRGHRFDLTLDFQGLFRTAFFSWVTGSKDRFGMAGTKELSRIFYTRKVKQTPESIHLVDYYADILKAADIPPAEPKFELPRDSQAEEAAGQLLAENSIEPDRYAVLVPGSAHVDKCWPVERFAEIADLIADRYKLAIVATGTPSESPTVDRLAELARTQVINLAGRTSIRELVALMRTSAAVVSNDTGPGHIAAALAPPLVIIFGRSNPARVAPYARPWTVAAVDPDGRGPKADNFDPRYNINNITTRTVFEKLAAQLDRTVK